MERLNKDPLFQSQVQSKSTKKKFGKSLDFYILEMADGLKTGQFTIYNVQADRVSQVEEIEKLESVGEKKVGLIMINKKETLLSTHSVSHTICLGETWVPS